MHTLTKQLLTLCSGGSKSSTRKLLLLLARTTTPTTVTVTSSTITTNAASYLASVHSNNRKRQFIEYNNSCVLNGKLSHGGCSSSSRFIASRFSSSNNNGNNNYYYDNPRHYYYDDGHSRHHVNNRRRDDASQHSKRVCPTRTFGTEHNGHSNRLPLPCQKHSHFTYQRQELPSLRLEIRESHSTLLGRLLRLHHHPPCAQHHLVETWSWPGVVSSSTAVTSGTIGTQLRLVHTKSVFNQLNKSTVDIGGSPDNRNMEHSDTDYASDQNLAGAENKEKNKSRWLNWTGKNSWKGGLLFMGALFGSMGSYLVYTSGAPALDDDGEIIKDIYSDKATPIAYCLRTWRAVNEYFQWVKDPTSEKLLPDPLVHPYIQPPYTLVLELSGLLLKPEWDMKMGWRFKKRPGLDYFLQTCAQSGYEIVIFTLESASVSYPLTVSMDPQNVIWYRLFKEDTRYTSGVHIKDLNCLNRDLAKVILVDVKKSPYQLHPRNGVAVKAWDGSDTDGELYDLAAFLQTVAAQKVEDVRTVLQHYNQFDDPMAKFRENQAAVLKAHEELMKLQAEEKKHQSRGPIIPSELKRR